MQVINLYVRMYACMRAYICVAICVCLYMYVCIYMCIYIHSFTYIYVCMHVCTMYIYVTLSHLRSKEITGIHKPCIPHSNDFSATTEYKPVCIQM